MDVSRDKSRKEGACPEPSGSEKTSVSPHNESASLSGDVVSTSENSVSSSPDAHSDRDGRSAAQFRHVHDKQSSATRESTSSALLRLVGRSRQMLHVHELIKKVALCDTTVLIEGETGTGKELVAKAIHELGRRGFSKFVAHNCGATPDTLIESELFGHVKGAFTGAV